MPNDQITDETRPSLLEAAEAIVAARDSGHRITGKLLSALSAALDEAKKNDQLTFDAPAAQQLSALDRKLGELRRGVQSALGLIGALPSDEELLALCRERLLPGPRPAALDGDALAPGEVRVILRPGRVATLRETGEVTSLLWADLAAMMGVDELGAVKPGDWSELEKQASEATRALIERAAGERVAESLGRPARPAPAGEGFRTWLASADQPPPPPVAERFARRVRALGLIVTELEALAAAAPAELAAELSALRVLAESTIAWAASV